MSRRSVIKRAKIRRGRLALPPEIAALCVVGSRVDLYPGQTITTGDGLPPHGYVIVSVLGSKVGLGRRTKSNQRKIAL